MLIKKIEDRADIDSFFLRVRKEDEFVDENRLMGDFEGENVKTQLGDLKSNPESGKKIEGYFFDKKDWTKEKIVAWALKKGIITKDEEIEMLPEKVNATESCGCCNHKDTQIPTEPHIYDPDIEFHAELKVADDSKEKRRLIEGWASTEDIDRGGDITLATSFIKTLKDYLKNPVLLYMHESRLPIGKILSMDIIKGKGVWVKAEIDSTENKIWQKILEKTLRAFSFGFRIKKKEDIPKKPKGKSEDESAYRLKIEVEEVIRKIIEIELFEISIVSIPMNKRALFSVVKGFTKGTDLVCAGGCGIKFETKFIDMDIEHKAIVPYKKFPIAPDATKWSFTAVDGNAILGDPPDWSKYRSVHTWYDKENPETRGAYKLPHHKIIEGSIKTVKRGVYAAAVAVGGGRTPLRIPASDMPDVKSHLAKHYHEWDEQAPWERRGWEEFEEIKDELFELIKKDELSYKSQIFWKAVKPFNQDEFEMLINNNISDAIQQEDTKDQEINDQEEKAGRVLSAKNRGVIQKARDALNEVLEADTGKNENALIDETENKNEINNKTLNPSLTNEEAKQIKELLESLKAVI